MDSLNSTDPIHQRIQYLFSKLSSSHSSICYRALTELRTEFIPKPHLLQSFIQAEGMKHIVAQLQKSNRKIVDVSLSILGHCVLEHEPRNIFRKEGGLPILVRVLRSFEDDTAILSRGCRVIGSLAHDKKVAAKCVLELSVHHTIGTIIDRSTDEEILTMAIRAIHNLSDSKEHVAVLGKSHIYPKLSNLLMKTENINIQKKLFATFSHIFTYMKRFPESSAHYWIGCEGGGKVIARFVELRLSTSEVITIKAPQLLYQLVQDKHVRPLLASKDAFEALIPVVKEEKELGKCGTTVYLSSLLLLCRESPNLFFQVGGIPILLSLIRESDPFCTARSSMPLHSQRFRSQHNNIFSTLLAFKYDTSALAELVSEGVVDILTTRLTRYVELCRSGKTGCTLQRLQQNRTQSSEAEISSSRLEESFEEPTESRQKAGHSESKIRCRSRKQYRTNSPSYQAVEMEYDKFSRLRESSEDNQAALNIFGWNPDRPNMADSETASPLSSPRSQSISSSPTHSLSTWSDFGSDGDAGSDYSSGNVSPAYSSGYPASPASENLIRPIDSPTAELMSPLCPPTLPSSSDFEHSDDEEKDQVGCYSPTNVDFELDSESDGLALPTSPKLPCKKRAKTCQSDLTGRKLCCEKDLKMLWLKLGQVDDKDFYENWPEFATESHQIHQQEVAVYLLLKLSWLEDTPKQLTDLKTVKAVIDYLIETPTPTFRACQFLFRLASCQSLFVDLLLRSQFPLEVYLGLNRRLTTVHCCPLHSSLRRVAEQVLDQMASIVAQFGRGEIENILLKSSDDLASSAVVAMAAPLIVKSRGLLRRYVNDLQILDTIGKQLRSPNTRAYAAASLSSLGSFLKMDDFLSPRTALNDLFSHEPCQVVNSREDIFFQIIPDQRIGGVKSRLQGASFFEAMFRGGFQESQSNVVPLVDIQAPVLKVILHLIYGCGCQCAIIRSIERLVNSDRSALSLLESLDQFLLFEQLDGISNLIASQDWSSSPNNFIALWTSLDSGFPFVTKLRNHLQYFPFSNAADFDSRFQLIDTVLRMETADETIEIWKKMFLSRIEDK